MTYEAVPDGVLIEVLGQEGETLPIGQAIARIGAAGEEATGDRPQATEDEAAEEEATEDRPQATEEPEVQPEPDGRREPEPASSDGGGNGRVKASPVARRMARE